jgi:uroporphyrinogen-III synthase
MKITSIFLSSESNSSLPLVHFCAQNNIRLTRQSLISFQSLDFSVPSNWDVVFFSSPRSFDFFTTKEFVLKANQTIACIGNETKKHIESKGHSVSFVGEEAGKPKEVGVAFQSWLGKRIALFPQSNKSNKSVEKAIPGSQRIPLLVYETCDSSVKVDLCSLYVFTSPSNFNSFLLKNTISTDSKIIAWGETTDDFIVKYGYKSDYVLKTSGYEELLEIFSTLIS